LFFFASSFFPECSESMDVAINAAWWMVGKALAPVAGTVLEAWAASAGLGPNVQALTMELLYVQAMLNGTRGRGIDNPALDVLLHKLRDLAYDAEVVLDEVDYFRIQDELDGTSKAADEHAKSWAKSLVVNARHTAKALGGRLIPLLPPTRSSDAAASGARKQRARDDVGNKRLPCSSLQHVGADGTLLLRHNVPQTKRPGKTQKLEFDRVGVSKEMAAIVNKLKSVRGGVSEILKTLGYIPNTAQDFAHNSRPMTTSESTEPRLYGRDLVMNSIIHDITQGEYCGNEFITVLPVVGPGGIGKTTLTQHIYHSQKVQDHFHVKVWKCVSPNFNVDKLAEEILKCIPKPKDDEKEGTTTADLISQRLKSARFLLVLDDMWKCSNVDEWKRLLLPFKKSQVKGNIIIVTTRFPAVADMVKTADHPIELQGLGHEEFKELFLAFIFADQQTKRDQSFLLLETGDKIVNKLKGSPLAAKTVGRLLRNHIDLDHWTRVLESKEWELETSDHDIMPALKLSYDYLPFHLQQCFMYCALFPGDYEFDSEELIHFWIGLDILHYSAGQNKKVEDIGMICLNDLVSYGFFKKEEKDGRPHYLIHDLLHDLALRVASCDCVTIDRSNLRSLEIPTSVRHLCVNVDHGNDSDELSDESFIREMGVLKERLKVENLRTLMVFGEMDESLADCFRDVFGKANGLYVLRLTRMPYCMESMLPNFSTLIHLRYLHLGSYHSSEIHLPSALSRFYHLRILNLKGWQGPFNLPGDMSNLTRLRHFATKDDAVHSKVCNVGKLRLLQELKKFEVNKENYGFDLKQLGSLIELTELGIDNLEKISTQEEAAEAKLGDKRYLHNLTLGWDSKRHTFDPLVEELVLESLQPHRNLKYLCIRGHGGCSCPTWLLSETLSVRALQSLHLVGVSWEVLPSLGNMWLLQELTLENMFKIQIFCPSHFDCITGQSFRDLKMLSVIGLKLLERWALGDNCHLFHQLQVLIIEDCPKLLGLPFADDISYPPITDQENWFPNLQKLEIKNCPKVELLPPIPWTRSLCSMEITGVGTSKFCMMKYSKSSSKEELRMTGKDGWYNPNKVLVFNNLTNLQELDMAGCIPLELKHLQMLTSLKRLTVKNAFTSFVPSESEGVDWQLSVETLWVEKCGYYGNKLTQLLSYLPKLSDLTIADFQGITGMGVAASQRRSTTQASSSTAKMEEPQATCRKKKIAEAEQEENVDHDDGLLLFPANLSNSLRQLDIRRCSNLSLVAPPPVSNDCEAVCVNGLALCSLQKLRIEYCPRLLSAYKTPYSSSCCPFPSSLRSLDICGGVGVGTGRLEFLSKLTSLTQLRLISCGGGTGAEGLWPLLARGQLRELTVFECPSFFVCPDPTRGSQGEDQQQLRRPSPKLQELWTDDIAGVLTAPLCSVLSSSLTKLTFCGNHEVKRFTMNQENALQLLTYLEDLKLFKLTKLQCHPSSLHTLPNFKRLELIICPLINSLPKDGLPLSLQEISISHCENEELKVQCEKFVRGHPQIKLI
jgi:hypothetical protein